MRNRIWTELEQAKFSLEFSCLYSLMQRNRLRYFNTFILILSSGGAMGWKIWDYIPTIACGIIAIVSVIRLIQPNIIMSEKQICNLDKIHRFYSDYFNKLEMLWYDLENGVIDELSAKTRFFEIKNSEMVLIDSTIDDNLRSKPKHLMKRAEQYTHQYLNQIFKSQPYGEETDAT